jgi:hypothetical protein
MEFGKEIFSMDIEIYLDQTAVELNKEIDKAVELFEGKRLEETKQLIEAYFYS